MKVNRLLIMLMCVFFLTSSICCLSSAESLDSSDIKWDKKIDISGSDYCEDMIQTDDGDVFIVGYSSNNGWILKLDDNGNELWRKTLTKDNISYIHGIEKIDGGFILVGNTQESYSTEGDIWLVKLDNDGDEIWSKTVKSEGYSYTGGSVKKTSDGGYVVFGKALYDKVGNNYGASKGLLLKVNSEGNLVWKKIFGDSGFDSFDEGMIIDDGSILICGDTNSFDDMWLFKTDENGDEIWNKTLSDSNSNCYSMLEASDDSIYLIGYDLSTSKDVIIIKTNEDGEVQWQNAYGGNKKERGVSLLEKDDGNLVAFGSSNSFQDAFNNIFWIFEIDNTGNEIWNTSLYKDSLITIHEPRKICETTDGGYLLVGNIYNAQEGRDVWLVKIGGTSQVQHSTPESDNTPGFTIAILVASIGFILFLRRKKLN